MPGLALQRAQSSWGRPGAGLTTSLDSAAIRSLRTLDDWLAHCERLNPKSMEFARERVEFTLERVLEVRARLDLRFGCPLISVAGTNGKGSTCAMIESIVRHAGYRTALSIKPHLVHFEERCRLDGAMVDAPKLLPHFEAVESARGTLPLTYF